MFGKFAASLARVGKSKQTLKYKFEVQVLALENLPGPVKRCQIIWSRAAKTQMTSIKDAVRGTVVFKETLVQMATMYKDKDGRFEAKEYLFRVKCPGAKSSDGLITIGKADVDLAEFADCVAGRLKTVSIEFKIAGHSTGYLKLSISSHLMSEGSDDGMTEVSGMTGMTSDAGVLREQDLAGFDDANHKFTKKAKEKKSLPSTKEVDEGSSFYAEHYKDEKNESEEEEESAPKARKGKGRPTSSTSVAAAAVPIPPATPARSRQPVQVAVADDDDEDISPMQSDSEEEPPPPPPPPPPPSRTKSKKSPSKVADDEDPGTQAMGRVTAAARAINTATTASAIDLDSMQSAAGNASRRPPSASSRAAAANAPAPAPRPVDEAAAQRSALFSTGPRSKPTAEVDDAAAQRSALFSTGPRSKPSAEITPQSADEDSQRASLFGVMSPPAKGRGAKAEVKAPTPAVVVEAPKAKLATPPRGGRAAKVKSQETLQEEEEAAEEAAAAAAAAEVAAAAAAASAAKPRKGSRLPDLDQLTADNEQLRRQLSDIQSAAEARERELQQEVQLFSSKVAELEDRIAEVDDVDAGAMFHQMQQLEQQHTRKVQEMVAQHKQDMMDSDEQHRSQLDDMENRARSEYDAMVNNPSIDPAMVEKLEQQTAEIERLDKQVALLQASLAAAGRIADRRVAEAEESVEEMLLTATRGQSERRALQDQVERLKHQLEDQSELAASNAMSTHMAGGDASKAVDEDLVEQLEDKVEALEAEINSLKEQNAYLQKTPSKQSQPATARQSAAQSAAAQQLQISVAANSIPAPQDQTPLLSSVMTHLPHPRCVEQSFRVQAELDDCLEQLHTTAEGLEDCFAETVGLDPQTQLAAVAVALSSICNARAQEVAQLQERCSQLEESARSSGPAAPKVKLSELHIQVQRLNTERDDMQSQNDSLKLQLKDSRVVATDALKQSDAAAGLRGQNRQLQQSVSKLEAYLGTGSVGMATTIVELELQVAELQAAGPGVSKTGDGVADSSKGVSGTSGVVFDEAVQSQDKREREELQQQLEAERERTATLTQQVDVLQQQLSAISQLPAPSLKPAKLVSVTSFENNPFASASLDDDPPDWNNEPSAATAVPVLSVSSSQQADRTALEAQIAKLTADSVSLAAQVVQLTDELETQVSLCLSQKLAVERLSPSATSAAPAITEKLAASGAENAVLRSTIAELQAQVLDFADADSIIKEWSDYADTLTKEHAALTVQHDSRTAELAALTERHVRAVLEHEPLAKDLGLATLEKATLVSNIESLNVDCERLTQQVDGLNQDREKSNQLMEKLNDQLKNLNQQLEGQEAELESLHSLNTEAESTLHSQEVALTRAREKTAAAVELASSRESELASLQAELDAATEDFERLDLLLSEVRTQAAEAEERAKTAAEDATAAVTAQHEAEAALAVVVMTHSAAASPAASSLSPSTPEATRTASLPRPGDRRLAEQVTSLLACKADLESEIMSLRLQLSAAAATASTISSTSSSSLHLLPAEEPSPTPSTDQQQQQRIKRHDTDDVAALAGWDARVELLLRERSVLQATIDGLTAVNSLTLQHSSAISSRLTPNQLFSQDSGDLLNLGWSTPTDPESPLRAVPGARFPSFRHSGSEREQSLQASLQEAVVSNTELKVLVVNLQSELEQAPLVSRNMEPSSSSRAGAATVTYRTSQGWGPGGPTGTSNSSIEDAAALFGISPSSLHLRATHTVLSAQLDRAGSIVMLPSAISEEVYAAGNGLATGSEASSGALSSPKGALLLKLERLTQERTILTATVAGLRSELERLQTDIQELRESGREQAAASGEVEQRSWQLQDELDKSQQDLAAANSETLALQHLLELSQTSSRDAVAAAVAAAATAAASATAAATAAAAEAAAELQNSRAGFGMVPTTPAPWYPGGDAHGGRVGRGSDTRGDEELGLLRESVAELQAELEMLKGGSAFALEMMRKSLGHSQEEIEEHDMDFETALDMTTGRIEDLQDSLALARRSARDASAHASELQDLLESCELERQALEEQIAEAESHKNHSRPSTSGGYASNPNLIALNTSTGMPPRPGQGGILQPSTPVGMMLSSNGSMGFSYGHDRSLTLSALEQQLALSEAARGAVETQMSGVVERAGQLAAEALTAAAEGARLVATLSELREAAAAAVGRFAEVSRLDPLTVLGADLASKVIAAGVAPTVKAASSRSGGGRPGSRGVTADEDSDSDADLASIRGKATAKRELTRAQKSISDLSAAKLALESTCDELEERSAQQGRDIETLEGLLVEARGQLAAAVAAAALAAQLRTSSGSVKEQRQMEESSPVISSKDLSQIRRKMADLESRCARLSMENTSLAQQLAEEVALREQLEEQVLKRLEDFGDEDAQDIVGAFETKYSKLKDRYKALQESSGEEVDELQQEIDDLHTAAEQMQAQLKSAMESRPDDSNNNSRRGNRAPSNSNANTTSYPPPLELSGRPITQFELLELVRENNAFVQHLVEIKMELALASEAEVQIKRDLYKAKDVNMKLAAKLTKLEAQAYTSASKKK